MKIDDHFTKFGTFSISPDKQIFGELCVLGPESYLYLGDSDFFSTSDLPENCITGTLHDLTKVTLFQCITTEGPGTISRRGESYHYSRIFPHFVICGDRYLSIHDRAIRDITFIIEDASTLFYDFDAFGSLIDARPYIEEIVKANKLDREVAIGENPQIAYFTGKSEIVRVRTAIGEVSACPNPAWNTGGPSGVRIDNSISVTITPDALVTFREATDRILDLLRFLEVVIGRPQKLNEFLLRVGDDAETMEVLRVYWSLAPGRRQESKEDKIRPHPADVLTDPISNPSEFSTVLMRWMAMDAERRDARGRFSNSFGRSNEYSIDRLVGAANMFDILPASSVPKDVELSPELLEAKQHCKHGFEALSPSPERSSILNALGRLGKSTLKHKVRFRAKYIIDSVGQRFPDIILVIDEAVNCRNHYVHGSESKIDYSSNFDLVVFFIDTLEFVFAAADLIESGWDIRAWCEAGTTMSHPFGRYRVGYAVHLATVKKQLGI